MDEVLKRDQNHITVLGGITDDSNQNIMMLRVDPATKRLLVSAIGVPGLGTVTSVSVTTANGFAGTVANPTSTPAITLETTINAPILAGDGTALIAATTTGTGSTAVLSEDPVFPASITVGSQGGTTGDILIKGSTSGTVTLSVQDAAGTWTMKLPTTAGTNGYALTTDGSGNTSWTAVSSGYNLVQTDGTPVTQRNILNFSTLFTVTDNAGNTSTDIDINVENLAEDTTFIDFLVANNYFTTELANNSNFITELTNNTTFQNNITTIVNNSPTLSIDLTTQVTGVLPVANGGTGAATLTGVLVGNGTSAITGTAIAQGDLFYGSAVNTLTALAKNTTATRYLSNTGTSNNPAWAQVNLTNGVTGALPLANGGTGAALSDPGFNAAYVWDDTMNATRLAQLSGLSYDSSSNTLTSSGGAFSATSVTFFDDFLAGKSEVLNDSIVGAGAIGALNWTFVGDNERGSCIQVLGSTGRPGVIRMESAGSNDIVGLFLGYSNNLEVINNGGTDFLTQSATNVMTSIGAMNQGSLHAITSFFPNATTSIHAIVGFVVSTNVLDITPTSGIYFELDTAVDANWRGVCRNASTSSTTAGTVAATTAYKKFEILVNGAGTSVDFLIDGVSLGTVSTNIPSTNGVPMYQYQQLSASARNLDIDYWWFNLPTAAR